MRHFVSNNENIKLEQLKAHMPSIIGGQFNRIIKTAKFEESYSSRLFKKPVTIANLYKHRDDGFKLTFKQFISNNQGVLTYPKTSNDYINNMVDDAISKFNLFKSFVYRDVHTDEFERSDGFNTLKFDLILSVNISNDGFCIEQLQVKAYYKLLINQSKRYYIYIKDKEFYPSMYFEIRYTEDGTVVSSSTLFQFIKTVESIWDCTFDFNQLDINGMKTTTEMLLI